MPVTIGGSGTITGLTATGISAEPIFPGNVIQVVSAVYSTEVTSTSTTYADTGLSASITPSSSSNKILVIVNQYGRTSDNSFSSYGFVQLVRGSTMIQEIGTGISSNASTTATTACQVATFSYLDSPSTTATTTYKTQFKRINGGAYNINVKMDGGASQSSMVLMEVAV